MVQPHDLLQRLKTEPFHPFTVILSDGTRIAVPIPRMLVGPNKALIVTKWTRSRRGFPIALDWRQVPLEMIDRLTHPTRHGRTLAKH